MAFMKKDVNMGLLVLIIASIVLFSAFSVYYQTTFNDISLEYKTKLEQLSKVTTELATQRQALNETYSLKTKAEQDRQTLDSRYTEVRDENDGLKSDNTNLRSEVSSTKSQLGEKSAELAATENLLAQVQTQLGAANSEVTSLKSQRSSLKSDIDRLCAKLVAAGGSDSECST